MAKRRLGWKEFEKALRMPAKDHLIERLRDAFDDPQEAWNEFATLHAENRHNNDFATRRGSFIVPDLPTASGKAFCLFYNRPYPAMEGGTRRREKLMGIFRGKLQEGGISELAYGIYPRAGEERAGYTFAIMLDADYSMAQIIIDGFHQSVRETDEWQANILREGDEIEHRPEIDDAEEGVDEELPSPSLSEHDGSCPSRQGGGQTGKETGVGSRFRLNIL